MKKPIFLGQIKESKVVLQKSELWELFVGTLPEDCYIEQTIKKVRSTRSKQQRGYYFGVMIPLLCDKTGLDKDEMNEMLKWIFNPKTITIGDLTTTVGMSIENEATDRVEEIYKNIREWAAADPNVSCYIPLPRETDWLLGY